MGSVVVPADGFAHMHASGGWTGYDLGAEGVTWEHMLSCEGAVRLVH
jgi:hypothetical protein